MSENGLQKALHAAGPAADRAEALALYGWLVGDWVTEITVHAADGARHRGEGEIHAGWILEGRAIQDVWTIARPPGSPPMPLSGNWYGTTIRAYDPALDAWRITWIDPATNAYRQQIGRKTGAGIVQEGTVEGGALSRWSFRDIMENAFQWQAEISVDQGRSWRRVVDVSARRSRS
jgi:hypothetical protein